MRLPLITLSKFVGTVSLGLLTGVSYSLSRITFPSLLHLPTATAASQAHAYLKSHIKQSQRFLSRLSFAAFAFAFFFSPRRARHPYLLWTALVCVLGASPSLESFARRYSGNGVDAEGTSAGGRAEPEQLAESAVMVGGGSSDSEEDRREAVNGEIVRRHLERGRSVEAVKTGVWGAAFAMSVVGLWGDGA